MFSMNTKPYSYQTVQTLLKPDVFRDELAAAAAGISADDDLGMMAFGLSAVATPSGSESAASVKP